MTAQARLLGGRYQVGELLGYGGMAEVHRGRDLRLGRDVAIKLLRTDLARDLTFQERFRREAQNAAALNHPAIVAVYDTGEEIAATGERLPFIVMEFVNGRTLKEVLAAEGRLMPRRALEITADICAALEFSHRHGIIHRDIKPGNVMLTQNGQVKVMDFGIARALASGATTMTQTSAVIGTAQYLSPEQARGEAVDARSDVYAAGCVLFELLCGHPPFVGDSPVSVAYQHVREDPPTPSDINHDVPPDVDAIVLKALAKNPLNRYQSGQEMRADVLRAVAGRPVMATPVLREDETVAMAPAPRSAATMTRPIPAAAGPPPRRRTSSWVMAALAGLGVLAVVALVVGLILTNQRPSGPPDVSVPNVIGQSQTQAEAALRKVGLVPQAGASVKTSACNKNKVADQNPKEGGTVKQGGTVVINVCTGPDQVQVPDLSDTNRDAAERLLKGAKLEAKFDEVDDERPEGNVIDWSPKDKSVPPGTVVTVKISKGNLVPVPNVVGSSEETARGILRTAGFKVRTTEVPVPAGTPAEVTEQDPPANQKRPKGSTVTIVVAVPEEPVPDPSGSSEPPDGDGEGT